MFHPIFIDTSNFGAYLFLFFFFFLISLLEIHIGETGAKWSAGKLADGL